MRKSITEYTFSDDAMFMQVMKHDYICKIIIEALFGQKISTITRHTVQSTVQPTVKSKGIRFDVCFTGDGKVYDIEMQKFSKRDLMRRARYYLAVNDVEHLQAGMKYNELPESYVIFICMFDPFGAGFAKYEQEPAIKPLNWFRPNGTHVIYLNVNYEKVQGFANVDEDVASLLDYLRNPDYAIATSSSTLVSEIDYAVQRAKFNAKERSAIMSIDEVLEERFEEGKEEGRAEGKLATLQKLKEMGLLPDDFEMPKDSAPSTGTSNVQRMKLGD